MTSPTSSIRDIALQAEWQPIATAPRDGRAIWVHGPALIDPDFNPSGCVEACFDGDRFLYAQWDGQFDSWNTVFLDDKGTHWMPFPPPPDALLQPVEPMKEQDHSAGLIHPTIPTVAETEPRLNKCVFCKHDIISCAGEVCDPCADWAVIVIEKFHAAFQDHAQWCGYNRNAPGSGTFREAMDAYQQWRALQVGSASVAANSGIAGPMSPAHESLPREETNEEGAGLTPPRETDNP